MQVFVKKLKGKTMIQQILYYAGKQVDDVKKKKNYFNINAEP